MTEEELIFMLKRNDNKAFKAVYKDCFPMVMKYISQNNGNQEDAEDVFQETLIVLIKKLQDPAFQLSAKLSSYMFSISKNMWLYRLRSKKNTTSADETLEEMPDTGIDEIGLKQERDIKIEAISDSLNELKEDCRRLLIDFYYFNKPLIEIASDMHLTEKFIRVKKYRCMESYREIVNRIIT
ncbi:MAG: sigma-70 family RNA polymerase sigma factor [Saprospiraceae bacterium]